MDKDTELRNELAEYAHDTWSGWVRYMFSKCRSMVSGDMLIPAAYCENLKRLITSSYCDLAANERVSDLKEADKILAVIKKIEDKYTMSGLKDVITTGFQDDDIGTEKKKPSRKKLIKAIKKHFDGDGYELFCIARELRK